MRHADNQELLAGARAGETDALWALLLNYEVLVRSTVRRVVDSSNLRCNHAEFIEATARDITVLAQSKFDTFSGTYPQLSHWIRAVARNHALRSVQREQRREAKTEYIDTGSVPESEPLNVVPSAAEQYEQHADDNDRAKVLFCLDRCLDKLAEQDADLHKLVWLKYKRGWSHHQIKTLLEGDGDFISVPAVGKRIEKGRKLLAACIREGWTDG